VPGAQLLRKIPPRTAHSIEIKHSFKKVSLTQPSRCSGLRMLCLFDRCFKLLPNSIANHSSGMFFRHPKSESDCLKFVHLKIREHNLEQMPEEISKWPRRNGLSARKRQRPMSKDLGLLPMTPQTGHCARAASQAILKESLENGLARRGVSGCVASAGQALRGLSCLRALPETPRPCHHFGNLFRHLL